MLHTHTHTNTHTHCIIAYFRPLLFGPNQPWSLNQVEKNSNLRVLFWPRSNRDVMVEQTVCSQTNQEQPEKFAGCSATSGNNFWLSRRNFTWTQPLHMFTKDTRVVFMKFPLYFPFVMISETCLPRKSSIAWLSGKICENCHVFTDKGNRHSVC